MVRCSDDDRVARQIVDLHQERSHHTLDLPGLVHIAALLAHSVEFVEEQDAGSRSGIVEHPPQPARRLPQEAADNGVVANDEKRDRKRLRERFGQRCLPVPGRADQQDPVARLQALRTQQAGAVLFLDELPAGAFAELRQEQVFETFARRSFRHVIPNARRGFRRRVSRPTPVTVAS